MAETYTTKEKVLQKLGTVLPVDLFDDATITEFIEDVQDDIDKITGHAWREATHEEYLNPITTSNGTMYKLFNRAIREFDATKDKIIYYDASGNEIDVLNDKVEGRSKDFWLDELSGELYFNRFGNLQEKNVKIKYRFGEATVPGQISKVATSMVVRDILSMPEYKELIFADAGGSDGNTTFKFDIYKAEINRILNRHKEIKNVQ